MSARATRQRILRLRAVQLVVTALSTLMACALGASAQIKEQICPNPDTSFETQIFGRAVDLSGQAFIAGAPNAFHPSPPARSGCAIYERVSGTWTLAYDAIDDFLAPLNAGWDVAIDGEWAAFSVIGHNQPSLGEVRVLHRDPGGWVLTQTLVPPAPVGPSFDDLFGSGVDISGTLMVIGSAYQEQAFVYRLSGNTWVHEATLDRPAAYVQPYSNFGYSVAVSQTPAREAVVVGQVGFDSVDPENFDEDGAAHIFVNGGTGWTLNTTVPPTAAPSLKSALGFPVAIDGDVVALGASYSYVFEPPFTSNGAALILRWNGSAFALSTTIVGTEDEFAGTGLAVDGDRVYVGHPYWAGIDSTTPELGRVTGHRWTGSSWTPWPAQGGSFHRVEPPTSFQTGAFGEALAASGGRLAVGAPFSLGAGAVHVLNVAKEGWKWTPASVGGLDTVVGSTGPAQLIGEGSIGAGDGHRLHLHGAKPNTLITLFVGVTAINAPFKGGVLVPNPQLVMYVPTNAAGDFHITTTMPGGAPAGIPIWHHMWWVDPAGPAGLASSNAIAAVTP